MLAQSRSRYEGVLRIVRYNWPFYLGALATFAATAVLLRFPSVPGWVGGVASTAAAAAGLWAISSLIVSYHVYDTSSLYQWDWLAERLDTRPTAWVNIHAGLDESSEALERMFPPTHVRVFDIYDKATMTEPSIERARSRASARAQAEAVNLDELPVEDAGSDAVFLLFSAHEIRDAVSRSKFFEEIHRILEPGGRVVLVEHLRDAMNFMAYGPGALHFYSRKEWLRVAVGSGLSLQHESRLTPFVGVFVFAK